MSLGLGSLRDHAATSLRPTTSTPRLTALEGTQKQLAIDKERSFASVALCKSGQRLISSKHRKAMQCTISTTASTEVPPSTAYATPRAADRMDEVVALTKGLNTPEAAGVKDLEAVPIAEAEFVPPPLDSQLQLADAFWAFDENDDGDMSVDELITLLTHCQMFDDEFLTPAKVKIYMASLLEGCNEFGGNEMLAASGIGLPQFDEVLKWIALMKGVPYDDCLAKLLRQAKLTCGNTLSMKRKLHVIFQLCGCKQVPGQMTAYEFACVCRRWGAFSTSSFTVGDVYLLFKDGTVDFKGFMYMLKQVGERLGMGHQFLVQLAEGADVLEVQEVNNRYPKVFKIGSGLPLGDIDSVGA
eukprot:TRINITY_DN28447_c0_g1_i1.p1 TRINITY_DN28447_c0_g1~~TRINITY_DN28447_c0_g1_i1.p1  ORF type:complete len:356 (-),score=79.84 TRINITY_DN28447_c0_g1_i1:361-1428(-)